MYKGRLNRTTHMQQQISERCAFFLNKQHIFYLFVALFVILFRSASLHTRKHIHAQFDMQQPNIIDVLAFAVAQPFKT